MQELDQTQELIQMLKERLNEKDETIATLQATIETLQITIANLTETLDEFKRKRCSTGRAPLSRLWCRNGTYGLYLYP